ncbi:Retrovirus-related Pol polyprotein from transposon RE1 [Bienertia sinuspersici]
MAESQKIHPATLVTNIKTHVPIVLDYDGSQYNNWSTLFKLHCRAYLVIDHITPVAKESESDKEKPATNSSDDTALWQRLDDIVRQWIYGTISNDLLNSILDPDDKAIDTWNRLENFFHNNKSARALNLDAQFTNTKLEQFDGVKPYCTRLKTAADSLRNVGDKVSDNRMALQLLKGLSEEYKPFRTSVRHLSPLPSFDTLRSMLELEEQSNSSDLASEVREEALVTASNIVSQSPSANSSSSKGENSRGKHKGKGKGSGGKGKGGAGRNNHQQQQHSSQQQSRQSGASSQQQQQQGTGWMFPPWPYWGNGPWATPPCPYPAQGPGPNPWTGARPSQPPSQGILGSRPNQAYFSSAPSPYPGYVPTNIEQAMHTMSLADPNYYMDTGATSHMTNSQGNLSPYFNLSNHVTNAITVGNGSKIPIKGYGHECLNQNTLQLKNVLHVPKIIKNLISVRKFTTDNHVSVEFDPFGFSVKDLQTGSKIVRCNSSGDLYPFLTDRHVPSYTTPSAFAVVSPSLWHSRLGHPGNAILSSLRSSNFIKCNKASKDVCHSRPLGKLIKTPFTDSLSHTTMPFDIIHSDLWTSPILSSLGHKYYVLFLDNYTNFLWTFPISSKSQVYKLFIRVRTYIRTQFEREIKAFQCDNGREFDNDPFKQFCQKHGMNFRFSCPYTSPQNGKSE